MTQTKRIAFDLPETDLALLDDWRFSHRVESRAEAIRQLMRLGLAGPSKRASTPAPAPPAAQPHHPQPDDAMEAWQGRADFGDRFPTVDRYTHAIQVMLTERLGITTFTTLAAKTAAIYHANEYEPEVFLRDVYREQLKTAGIDLGVPAN